MNAHLEECSECTRLASRLGELDSSIADAALVPLPDALADRVLIARRPTPRWPRYAAAASILLALVSGIAGPRLWDASSLSDPVEAVGPTHPAVAAIAMVVEQQPAYLDQPRSLDLASMEDGLKRLGLSLNTDRAKVDYAGKCYMSDTRCDHLVLDTADGQVSVILVPDYPVGSRVLVADRRMTALVSPAGSGAYIVVANSLNAAKRTEKLFVKG